MTNVLDTGIKNARNVPRYMFGAGAFAALGDMLDARWRENRGYVFFYIDEFFRYTDALAGRLPVRPGDEVTYVQTHDEPTTDYVDDLYDAVHRLDKGLPHTIVGIGGGTTLDVAKAVSNLLTNGGHAADYQGWDLVKVPGVFKIGIPTLSGTGAEATRTCVMTNPRNGLKLGMNSDFTVYNQLILDPELVVTVPRNQYFYTGMDAYIHCVESLNGSYRNAIGDAYSRETINLCRQVFLNGDMMSEESRERLMVASYLGGCAIATSYVGLIHPFSAGLSVVLGLHHCVANCITMRAMAEFYPAAYDEFWTMAERQQVDVPSGVCHGLTDEQYRALYNATVIHQKPLTNALGSDYRDMLTYDKVVSLFRKM